MSQSPWERNFIEQMVRLRKQADMKQTDLARKLADRGLSFHQQTVARIETGSRPVRLDEAFLIAQELGVDLSTMTDPPTSPDLRDLAFSVDRVQRRLPDARDALREVLGDYLETFEALVFEVQTRVGSELRGADLDPVTQAAMHYLFELNEIFAVVLDAFSKMGGLLGRGDDEFEFDDGAHQVVQRWVDDFIPTGLSRGPSYMVDTYNELVSHIANAENADG